MIGSIYTNLGKIKKKGRFIAPFGHAMVSGES